MMRMTKPSKFQDQIWKGTCTNCEAEFECDRHEIVGFIKTPTRYGTRDGEDYAMLDCSECQRHFGIRFKHHRYGKLLEIPVTTETVTKGDGNDKLYRNKI